MIKVKKETDDHNIPEILCGEASRCFSHGAIEVESAQIFYLFIYTTTYPEEKYEADNLNAF